MSKKIVLLNTWHGSFDDRVFYHQAKCLAAHGNVIQVISTKDDCHQELDGISIHSFNGHGLTRKNKMRKMLDYLTLFSPGIIICDSPLGVFASKKYKKEHTLKIIYDITEWYPSKIHLQYFKGFHKMLKFCVLMVANLSAGLKSDSFIFGEYYKSIEFRTLFFWKKYSLLPYFPDINYIRYYPLKKIASEINLLYTGKINTDKGIDTVIGAIKLASIKCPEIQFKLKIIGDFPTNVDQSEFNQSVTGLKDNVHINIVRSLPYLEFCKTIGDTNIFFDLRKIDFENTHCMPIKLFYYIACGRPVIYSNLKAIRKEMKDINFGYLCNPNEIDSVASKLLDYILQPDIYLEHATNALAISKSTYNWEAIENDFISFIESHVIIE